MHASSRSFVQPSICPHVQPFVFGMIVGVAGVAETLAQVRCVSLEMSSSKSAGIVLPSSRSSRPPVQPSTPHRPDVNPEPGPEAPEVEVMQRSFKRVFARSFEVIRGHSRPFWSFTTFWGLKHNAT